ncbi:hypothetical protein SAMN05216249_11576 [Acetitomaculum ruminis DSM 5522]|uniref:Uncharacterized protein n=1 Tax=Acetitomaculum ruminis DSM 5522 TaxID=1120918 RepID=A0A1I0ZJC5_9FIRM|nr:hypothetical protein [Acetitomaculum ruminis]SFB25547.1 hypothetical protein SAMN05216249_11576 [Acetitomaculum ruminis DSM 5522]
MEEPKNVRFIKSFIDSYNSNARKKNLSGAPFFRDYKDIKLSSMSSFDVIKIAFKKRMTCNINEKLVDITSVYLAGDYVIYGENSIDLLLINCCLGTGVVKERMACNIHVKRSIDGDNLTFSIINTIADYHNMLKSGILMSNTLAKQEDKINNGYGLKSNYKISVSISGEGILFRDSNKVLTVEEVCLRVNDNHFNSKKDSKNHANMCNSSIGKKETSSVINSVIKCPSCEQKLRVPCEKKFKLIAVRVIIHLLLIMELCQKNI